MATKSYASTMKIQIVTQTFIKEEGMQESDMLDQLPDGEGGYREDEGTKHVMLVSLGCFCGPKLSFKHMGRGSETLPFDWMRTQQQGLMHFLRHDFEGFFDFRTKKAVPDCKMTTFRDLYHSFWHDDPTDPGMRVRYNRRIARFNGIDASVQPVLFVRCIPSTDELAEVPELLNLLISRHGRQACLLCIIDFQVTARGAAVVAGHDNLLMYYLTADAHVDANGTPTPPYCKPVHTALDWIVGRPVPAMKFSSMQEIIDCSNETHWGLMGLGGLQAFESTLADDEEVVVTEGGMAPVLPPMLGSAALESQVSAEAPPSDAITFVSLGCSPATKLTLQHMGCGALPLPFDWLRVKHEGLVHFISKGFESPIREGLGAGGQRPDEEHGFFDLATRKKVPGTPLTMCRSHLHSYWHDDVADPDVRTELGARIDNFNSLGGKKGTILFVRAVTTTAELAHANELFHVLAERFGQQACLLLIFDFQHTSPGPYSIDGVDDILVYLLEGDAHANGNVAPYRKPIECAIEWLKGNPLEARCIADLETLQAFADETHWGLAGLGGLAAFERGADKPEAIQAKPSAQATAAAAGGACTGAAAMAGPIEASAGGASVAALQTVEAY